ncbi:MAG: phosphopantothenoylcysteine decarboxylase [Kiritimatiellae bacterium]|jgi:phosphopantothenoylcysteine decarboxylase/phosphopantothenate--cysteine ligase|nr:phosphopantothenoylcysteine decarboxylase [Kiritimatiellia bacterium]
MNVLVTAGPTREAIDPVRFVSNRSSGKMGTAIAQAARAAGHTVRLITGPVALPPPADVSLVRVTSAADMLAAVEKNLAWCDWLIMAAAVADWRPRHPASHKLKKADGPPCIEWEPAPDILATIAPRKKPGQLFCGFAAETRPLVREAMRKLRDKNLDLLALNDVSQHDRGFEADTNALTFFDAAGQRQPLPLAPKSVCAAQLIARMEKLHAKKI